MVLVTLEEVEAEVVVLLVFVEDLWEEETGSVTWWSSRESNLVVQVAGGAREGAVVERRLCSFPTS